MLNVLIRLFETFDISAHIKDESMPPDKNAPISQSIYPELYLQSTDQNGPINQQIVIHQNYPNPFNPVTTLRYDLPEEAHVHIIIYDMMGRIVNNLVSSQQTAGYKSVLWNATNNAGQPVSAGLYLYTIEAWGFRESKKMVLLK